MNSKVFTLIIVSVLLVTQLKAQDSFLISAGANISSIAFEEDSQLETPVQYKPGFNFGIGFLTPVSEKINIRIDILYQRKGYLIKGTSSSDTYNNKYKLNYMLLPILAEYYINKNQTVSILAGGYAGLLIGATADIDETSDSGSSKIENADIRSNFAKNDLGIIAGVGTKFSPKLAAHLKVFWGLKNITTDKIHFTSIKNRTFDLTLTYSI